MTTPSASFPRSTPPSLLILILDIHPLSWSLLSSIEPPDPLDSPPPIAPAEHHYLLARAPIGPITLPDFLNVLLVFLNSHLASRWGNRVVVFAASAGKSKLLYPTAGGYDGEEGPKERPNVYSPFGMLDQGLERGLKDMIAEEETRMDDQDGEGLNDPPAIVSAMTKALCYINRHSPPPSSESTAPTNETRILVINATPGAGSNSSDNSSSTKSGGGGMRGGYVGLMNCVFAAQKAKIPIDVLTLPPASTGTEAPIFLQQASHLTEGVYWRWNGRGGLLQYLHTIYLAPPALRQTPFSQPPQDAVDFRAVCFCHHDVVDVGFVCSVCLSIFCKPLPVCQMCK
ncbi:TFIIH subunit Tfb4/p34 [Dioszegia hungarica]|uniref:General transcription and DNA repair factor IIH subunit TFB4 n=1 Tax=Dioszegia hungarica TaxID=4972 RepID=A0AA38HBP9_9TREE|nr:TFIIH subunit Tfb4/p34 [Dioszegia hungarica]KAI9637162.1 TFIIH subunit Tfb4/p34 [Dioszegia hungarica]